MKSILLFTCLFLCFLLPIQGQNNVFKLNLTPLIIGDITVQYERVFLKKFSGSLGYGYMMKSGLPSAITNNLKELSGIKFSGSSFTPELRFYPHVLKDAPSGLYIAVYMKYSKYSLDATVPFTAEYKSPIDPTKTESKTLNPSISGSFSGIGGGLMIGKQMVIGGHFVIDLFIMGGHFGSGANISASTPTDIASSLPDYGTIRQDAREQLQAQLNGTKLPSFIPGSGNARINSSVTSSGISVALEKFPFIGARFAGFCIGFAF